MTKILLDYDEKIHKKLWNEKELLSIFWQRNISWEDFILIKVLGASEWRKIKK